VIQEVVMRLSSGRPLACRSDRSCGLLLTRTASARAEAVRVGLEVPGPKAAMEKCHRQMSVQAHLAPMAEEAVMRPRIDPAYMALHR
jgi:hypothetical protein